MQNIMKGWREKERERSRGVNLSPMLIMELSTNNRRRSTAFECSLDEVPLMMCHNKALTPAFLIGDGFFAASINTFLIPVTS